MNGEEKFLEKYRYRKNVRSLVNGKNGRARNRI
jgi:hypothetical protein